MSMLSTKLQELEEEGLEEKKEVEEEGHEATIGYGATMQKPTIEGEMEEGDSMEETDLEEILAQLEAEEKMKEGKKEVEEAKDEVEEGKKDMEEAKKEVEEGKKEVEEAKKKDDDKKKVEESLEEADDDDEMTELTVDELKDIIRDVLKDVLAGTEEEEGEGDIDLGDEAGAEAGEEEVEDEESISLDELLAELDKEEEGKKPVEEKKEVEEAKKEVEEGKKEEVDEAKKEVEEAKKDLEEAIKTIKTLQSELNEVNLLNAKLLYTNKIFKAKSLNEAQKVKVLKAFDKATNVKDVKTVYNTLSESLTIRTKSTIKESVGFASKAAGVAPKQPIVEGDAAIRRMQQLAGIIK
jgi:PAS domain-containing protein